MTETPSFDSFPSQPPVAAVLAGTSTDDLAPSFDSFPDVIPTALSQPTDCLKSKSDKRKHDGSRGAKKRAKKHNPQRATDATQTLTLSRTKALDGTLDPKLDPADSFLRSLNFELDFRPAPVQDLKAESSKNKKKKTSCEKAPPDGRNQDDGSRSSKQLVQSWYSDPQENTFSIDAREDRFNLHYGRPDKAKVPSYRRIGAGRVLGVNERLRITLDTAYRGDGLRLSQDGHRKFISIADQATFHLLNDKNLKRLVFPRISQQLPSGPAESFISIHELGRGDGQKTALLKPEPEHRSIFDESNAEEVDSDGDVMDYLPPDEDGGESILESLNKRKGELEQRTRENPGDLEAWLALVNLQDEMKELGLVGLRAKQSDMDPDAVRKHVQGTSDLKLSYLNKALQVPSNQHNEALLLAYMRAYCDQPDVDCSREWRKMLDSHPSVTALWIAYVDWRQTDAGSLNVAGMVEVYEELIDRLVMRLEAEAISAHDLNDYEQTLVYLFHRCCTMLKQAGFHERAVAAFQALIELNFFGTDDGAQSTSEILEDFESFWDSEAPRVGEPGAIGWSRYPPGVDVPPPPSSRAGNSITKRATSPLDAWQEAESRSLGPARTTDPDSDNDPFRCVLSDDIRNLLFRVSNPDSQQALVYSFLSFIGLCLPPPDVDTNVAFFTDPFLSFEIGDAADRQALFWPKIEPVTAVDSDGMRESFSGIKNPLNTPFRVFPSDPRQLFSDSTKWFTSFKPEACDVPFIQGALSLLRTSPKLKNDVYFTLCVIAFEARLDLASAIEMTKQILSEDQTCLLLWDTYARLCLLKGKFKTARDVYVKTLSLIGEEQKAPILLWYSWAEMEFEMNNFGLAARILARAVKCLDDAPTLLVTEVNLQPPAAVLLRTRRAFMSRISGSFHRDVPQDLLRQRVADATAFATLQYMTEGFELACEVFDTTLKAAEDLNSPAEVEEIWMSYSRMIYRHIREHRSYRPFEVRKILKRAVEKFHNNSVFLSLFAFNESKMKIDNETRRLVEATLLKNEASVTANSWLFAIWVEMHLNITGYNHVAVRRLFERALWNSRTRSSLQLWKLYIKFEILNGNFSKAKSIITRSHATCPWVKDLYLLPFSSALSEVYQDLSEQRRMLRLCDEKGIRIKDRVIFKTIEEMEKQIVRLEDEADDAAAAMERKELEERQRLLPY